MKTLFLLFLTIVVPSQANENFFTDISSLIRDNHARLSYGVAVTDFNNDGLQEFVVTGFGYSNLALSYEDQTIRNVITDPIFSDSKAKTIGVAACDIDGNGKEELYFLNTDSYSGQKTVGDRLLTNNFHIEDLFNRKANQSVRNLTAGRSVACVDRKGDGFFDIYVSNYGGPSRFYEFEEDRIKDSAKKLGMHTVTGGRAVVSGHILGRRNDVYAANERGPNFLYHNVDGQFLEKAVKYGLDDAIQNGRGTALADILYNGQLGIIAGNWNGYHRIFVPFRNSFADFASSDFRKPSSVRTIVSADFDNDGYDEIFVNNLGEPNRLFKVLDDGKLEQIKLSAGLEKHGLGTGAAVADIDKDGILELLISHGELKPQPLTLYKASLKERRNYIRISPKTKNNSPARGSTVILKTNYRQHAKTIDAGSGYLCQMEPTAHFGLRDKEIVEKVVIRWTDGSELLMTNPESNTELIVHQL